MKSYHSLSLCTWFSFIWAIKLCGWGRWRWFGGISFLDIITLQSFFLNDQSYLANETFCGNERLFVCCCNCVGSALGFPGGREGEGSNNFTLIYCSTPYQSNSRNPLVWEQVKFRKYNHKNIKLHQTYPGLIGNDQNIPFYEKPRPAFSTMNYVCWYQASGHVLCSFCIIWALQVYLFSFCSNAGCLFVCVD